MAGKKGDDSLLYFGIRARGEATRMLYAIAGKKMEDKRVTFEQWAEMKPSQPLGQLPTLTTSDGLICCSNVIARHVAKKFGMAGKTPWEETLHDMVLETAQDVMNSYAVPHIYAWMVFKSVPEPENKDEVLEKAKQRWVTALNLAEKLSKSCGSKKFLFGNEIGLADVWLWCGMDFAKLATPDVMSVTPFAKQWSAKFEADPSVKKYLAGRPDSNL